jgi:hypothetical protein
LKKPAVILSLEDDPVSGMPEDNPDGVSMDALKVAFKLLELISANGIPGKIDSRWRFVPPDDSNSILEALSHVTSDPNINPPWLPRDNAIYKNRVPYTPDEESKVPQTLALMLRDFGPQGFPSGWLQPPSPHNYGASGPVVFRRPVVLKSFATAQSPERVGSVEVNIVSPTLF